MSDPATPAAPNPFSPPPPPPPPPSSAPAAPGVPDHAAPSSAAPGYPAPTAPGLTGGALPAGVELASRGRRIGAAFLAVPLAFVTLGIGYFVWGVIVWSKGTSPALQVLGMRVVRPAEGRPASWGAMFVKYAVAGTLGSITFGIATVVSFVMFLTDDQHRTLGDRLAGTIVVRDPEKTLG